MNYKFEPNGSIIGSIPASEAARLFGQKLGRGMYVTPHGTVRYSLRKDVNTLVRGCVEGVGIVWVLKPESFR